MRKSLVLFGTPLLAVLWACSDLSVQGGGPTTMALTVDRDRALVGETFTFNFDATGASLLRVVLSYGDGAADTVLTFGSVTAGGRRSHAYAEAGSYTVEGLAEDAMNPPAVDRLTVVVAAPPS